MPAMTAIPFVRMAPSGAGLTFADSKKPLVSSRVAPRSQRLALDFDDDPPALIDRPNNSDEFQIAAVDHQRD